MADISEAKGHQVLLGRSVAAIHHEEGRVLSIVTRSETGQTEVHAGTDFISSIPVRELVAKLDPPAPESVRKAADSLAYRDFISIALMIDKADVFPDNWI